MVQVRVTQGVLEGEVVNNEYGGKYCSFKGIPYAEPPLGNLRFKAPQPAKPWTGVRSAKKHGPICYQSNPIFNAPGEFSGSEDCLYLNVYTPELKPNEPLPVMVWIHGGGFRNGSGNSDFYGPEFLVREGVILVTINYRLHALGFLSLGTEDVPGNAGMKDQVAALRWVKDNITYFGGDPGNVTIFGESAGGGSVSWLLISPMSKGLFKRAIAQSGVAISWWAWAFEPRERAIALAKKLGLDSGDDKVLYEFFKSLPVEAFTYGQVAMTFAEHVRYGVDVHFSIVSEKQFGNNEIFFYGDPTDAFRNGIHEGVEVISGYCKDEGLLHLKYCGIDKLIPQANEFLEFFVPKSIEKHCTIKEQLEVGRQMKKFYCGDEKVSEENITQVIKYLGTDMFVFSTIVSHRLISKRNKVYLYEFSCKTERTLDKVVKLDSVIKELKAIDGSKTVNHGEDLLYLFPVEAVLGKLDQNSKIFGIIEKITKLWTNFAKYGNPTPDGSLGVQWAPFTLERQNYLDIGTEIVPKITPKEEEFKYWQSIFRKYMPNYVLEN